MLPDTRRPHEAEAIRLIAGDDQSLETTPLAIYVYAAASITG